MSLRYYKWFHFTTYLYKPLNRSSKANQDKQAEVAKKQKKTSEQAERHIEQAPTALFFQYNTQLGPPYHVLVDTNFINFR